MPKFLSLTEINYHSRERTEVLVNLDNVSRVEARVLPAAKRYLPSANAGTPNYIDQPELRVSCVVFTAGMHEEVDAIYVTESLDTILRNA